MVMDYYSYQMEDIYKGHFKNGDMMTMVFIFFKMEKNKKVNGKMGKD